MKEGRDERNLGVGVAITKRAEVGGENTANPITKLAQLVIGDRNYR